MLGAANWPQPSNLPASGERRFSVDKSATQNAAGCGENTAYRRAQALNFRRKVYRGKRRNLCLSLRFGYKPARYFTGCEKSIGGGIVTGHDFSRADKANQINAGSSP